MTTLSGIITPSNVLTATYRQALRDVPVQEGFPWDVTWPESPNGN